MPTIQAELDIAAPQAPLFDLAQDYARRLDWDPFLRAIEFRGGAREAAVGVRVWVRAKKGLSMEVEYITLRRPEQVAMTMIEGPAIFRRFSGAWLFRALAPGRTRVIFRYHFAARPTWLAPLIEPVIGALLRRDMAARLAGLRAAAET